MKKYTVSVIANVTIRLIMECENEQEAKSIVDGMDYDQLLDEGVVTIYSTEEIQIDQDIKEYELKDFERMDPIDRKITTSKGVIEMREIKFRAWDKMYDDFINDGYIIFNGMIYRDERDFEDGQNTNDIELMQFTGLLDKNGVEIYEGDIVKVGLSRSNFNDDIGIVKYVKPSFVIHSPDFEDNYNEPFPMSYRVEVIGNIYENPELLEPQNGTL